MAAKDVMNSALNQGLMETFLNKRKHSDMLKVDVNAYQYRDGRNRLHEAVIFTGENLWLYESSSYNWHIHKTGQSGIFIADRTLGEQHEDS